MPGRSIPGSGGRTGSAPVASTSASYRSWLSGARLKVLHLDGAVLPIDAADFVPGANLDVKQVAEPLGRGDQQLASVGDHAADVVRQPAVGEGDVAASLEDEDFGVFIHAAEPRGARGAPGHAADD